MMKYRLRQIPIVSRTLGCLHSRAMSASLITETFMLKANRSWFIFLILIPCNIDGNHSLQVVDGVHSGLVWRFYRNFFTIEYARKDLIYHIYSSSIKSHPWDPPPPLFSPVCFAYSFITLTGPDRRIDEYWNFEIYSRNDLACPKNPLSRLSPISISASSYSHGTTDSCFFIEYVSTIVGSLRRPGKNPGYILFFLWSFLTCIVLYEIRYRFERLAYPKYTPFFVNLEMNDGHFLVVHSKTPNHRWE